jgi:A/G-specific adenine glycosylase
VATNRPIPASNRDDLSARLLTWYDRHARVLPWRARPGEAPDPYRIWLSEIMLQQTTTGAVGPYFRNFLERWPDVQALAASPLDDLLTAWAGLGYYARARNLHKCAKEVTNNRGGVFPETEEELRTLPGIGPYTAAAIAAIAFGRKAVVVDGNVERVMARIFAIDTPLPQAKPEMRDAAASLTPKDRAGDYAQAVMDLGATICTPRKPRCMLCPWADACIARRDGNPERYPVRAEKGEKPQRRSVAFVMMRDDGAIWLRKRPESGLLGGMMEVPSLAWKAEDVTPAQARRAAPLTLEWRELNGIVRHGFTHFDMEFRVWVGRASRAAAKDLKGTGGLWCPIDQLGDMALPTLMKKVLAHAMRGAALEDPSEEEAELRPKAARASRKR